MWLKIQVCAYDLLNTQQHKHLLSNTFWRDLFFLKEPRRPRGSPRAGRALCRTVLKPQKGNEPCGFRLLCCTYSLWAHSHWGVGAETGSGWGGREKHYSSIQNVRYSLAASVERRPTTQKTSHPVPKKTSRMVSDRLPRTAWNSRFNFGWMSTSASPFTASTHWSWTPQNHKKGRGSAAMYISDRAYRSTT